MTDIREAVLTRLVEIAAGIPGLRSSHRNNVDIPEELCPAAFIMDENEETDDARDMSQHPANKPIAVRMLPEIILVAEQSDQAGSALNAMRFELMRQILNDAQLNGLVGTNGAIRYIGCQTGAALLRTYHAAMSLRLILKYYLKPQDLT